MKSFNFLLTFLLSFLLTRTVLSKKPNIVLILTDDQDVHMNSLSYMPYVKKHLVNQGTRYQALCCPSRVSLLTGKAAHNTNVTDVWPPYGGYPKFIDQGLNDNYLPIWLQDSGYNTYYTGKLMNFHHVLNYFKPYAAGWTSSDFLLDPYTYSYLKSVWVRDNGLPVSAVGKYSTDVLAQKAFAYLKDGAKSDNPFFLAIAPIAPHANVDVNLSGDIDLSKLNISNVDLKGLYTSGQPIPADRHKSLFKEAAVPRTPNFNPDVASGVSWVSRLPKQNETNVDYNDEFYRNRLRALQAVDEMVDGVFRRLHELGILEDTYVIYTSDNGFHIGQHRLQPGKECGFEEDINVPLIIRGPGVPKGESTSIVTTHTDLAPTFFRMIGRDLNADFDGTPIPFDGKGIAEAENDRHEHVNVEHWGTASVEGVYGTDMKGESKTGEPENTYKALRLVGEEYNLYYSVFCNNEHELYNLAADPYQMDNLMQNGRDSITINGQSVDQVVHRLDALLMVLKTCKAAACIHPWRILHPDGDVKNLGDALRCKYDDFYSQSYRTNAVSFTKCESGQILSSEGPQEPLIYDDRLGWQAFV